ncbi:MAG TPA: biotin/lipoyl-containing protein [Elusimicrobiota bacterium]|nr:biotin/lipoyl-containing protein [Elusimicrobiota bacterium]
MMDTKKIGAVLDWMKSTDLVEVAFKRGGDGFALATADAPAPIPGGSMPASRFVPVASESVGVFQWSEPGKARKAEEGAEVAQGDVLGVVVSGAGAPAPVKAPCAGRVAKCFADAGEAVEYGRPLFLLEPKA